MRSHDSNLSLFILYIFSNASRENDTITFYWQWAFPNYAARRADVFLTFSNSWFGLQLVFPKHSIIAFVQSLLNLAKTTWRHYFCGLKAGLYTLLCLELYFRILLAH